MNSNKTVGDLRRFTIVTNPESE